MDFSADDELFDPPRREEDPDICKVLGRDFIVRMPESDTDWQMGPIQKERYRTYGESLSVEELSVLCIATQVWGPSLGRKAVMKIRIQTSQWSKDVSHIGDRVVTEEVDQEIDNLERLTKGNCSCTPHLIDSHIFRQTEDEFIPGGYISVVLMEKVPGHNLMNFDEFPLEKRNRVRIAFAKAMREFGQFGIRHWDPSRRNIIWDEESERCFIVDLEDAEYTGTTYKFTPYSDFTVWSLNSQYIRGDHFEDDPMVPTYEESRSYVDNDESLMALAARTENASRANILKKRQMHQDRRDGPKVVKIRTGRKNPSKVKKAVEKETETAKANTHSEKKKQQQK